MHAVKKTTVSFFGRIATRLILTALVTTIASPSLAQELTRIQNRDLKRISDGITQGGEQFGAGDFENSANSIKEAVERLEAMYENPSNELIAAAKPLHEQLTRAKTMLAEKGVDAGPIKPLPDSMAAGSTTPDNGEVSFTNTVAPIIVAKCGRCHVQARRGGFSFASYNALINSTVVTDGNAPQSRIIEVIESGEMPKGGTTVEPAELEALKKWITEGAKFDGPDADAGLAELGNAPPPAQTERMPTPEVQMATGKETVSFGLHVAPILVENCAGCHINTTNPRGNFSMANFRQLLRGGDSGPPVKPGSSMESTLFHRITGANGAEVMPPTGKLSDDKIATITKWIDEGAKFDGSDPRLGVAAVAATAKAASQSHDDLVAERRDLARKNWKTVMTDTEASEILSDNFIVLGQHDDDTLQAVADLAEGMVPEFQRALKSEDGPLLKGNIAIFVFETRYDFSEFGTMIEKRPIPRELSGHWGFNTIDAYVAVLLTRNQTAEDVKIPLATAIASTFTAGQSADIPRWFADGTGHWLASRVYSRDETVKGWESAGEQNLADMNRPTDFVTGNMPEHRAALVSFLFVKQLRSNSGDFRKLLSKVRSGVPFETSFAEAYGQTPVQMLGGEQGGGRRQGRRGR